MIKNGFRMEHLVLGFVSILLGFMLFIVVYAGIEGISLNGGCVAGYKVLHSANGYTQQMYDENNKPIKCE